jgi:hypothetical protein
MANNHDQRRRDMLAALLAAGGSLDVADWRELGLRHGYNPRGLVGYFGGRYPSMVSDGRRRCLTDRGRRRRGSPTRLHASAAVGAGRRARQTAGASVAGANQREPVRACDGYGQSGSSPGGPSVRSSRQEGGMTRYRATRRRTTHPGCRGVDALAVVPALELVGGRSADVVSPPRRSQGGCAGSARPRAGAG